MSNTAPENMHTALVDFCETIEATGGCVYSDFHLSYVPAGDREWVDLAMAYRNACAAIGRTPVLYDAVAEEDNE